MKLVTYGMTRHACGTGRARFERMFGQHSKTEVTYEICVAYARIIRVWSDFQWAANRWLPNRRASIAYYRISNAVHALAKRPDEEDWQFAYRQAETAAYEFYCAWRRAGFTK